MVSPSFIVNSLVLMFILKVFTISGISAKTLLSSAQGTQVNDDNSTFDWRDKGVISPVQDDWTDWEINSWAITAGVESLHAMQTGKPAVWLSTQEFSDCCEDEFHLMKYSGYDCISIIGGLCTQEAYDSPLGTCNNATCTGFGMVNGTVYIEENREDLMLQIIHKTPLTAYIDGNEIDFLSYMGFDIYSDPNCSTDLLNSAVQIVGYGTESGVDYWIIKNFWGSSWGEQGFMRIVRGQNMCGIASKVFYPIANM